MKTIAKISSILLAAALMSFSPAPDAYSSLNSVVPASKAGIKWKSTEISLGEIAHNKPVTIEFEFTNIGENPVLITGVQASCGCTSTNYAKTPILPGETTKISAVFNASAKGLFKKQVTVTTNAEETPVTLSFSGTVI